MRPHHLTIEALGPYAESVDLDFDELAADGLFLIHGRTGAGKTFLLDALCLALYGEVPGARGKHTLRSDHADPRATPRVTLEFSVHEHRYRVERVPAHTVAKSRGDGVTDKPAKAALWRNVEGTWAPVAGSVTEVNREIGDLLGLTASQFQQVILLPQGQFEQVLRAGSAEREQLLKTLFDTVLHEQVTDWLDAEAKRAVTTLTEAERELAAVRSRAGQVARTDTPTDQTGFDTLVVAVERTLSAAVARRDGACRGRDRARAAQQVTDAVASRWHRRHGAAQRWAALEAQADRVAAARRQLADAVAASHLRAGLEAEQGAAVAMHDAGRVIGGLVVDLVQVRGAAPFIPSLVSALSLDPDDCPTSELLTIAAKDLAADRSRIAELEHKEAQARTLDAAIDDLTTQIDRSRADATDAHDRVSALRAEATALDGQIVGARAAQDRLEGLDVAATATRAQAEAARLLAGLRTELERADAAWRADDDAVRAREHAVNDLRRRYLDGIAAVLAGTLEAGDDCPVCGSHDHPRLAQPHDDAVTLDEVDAADARAATARSDAATALDELNELRTRVTTLEVTAGDLADDADEAERRAHEAEGASAAARALADDVPVLLGRQQRLGPDLATAERLVSSAAATIVELETATEGHDRQRARLRADIADELGPELAPTAALAGLDAIEPVLDALRQAQRRREECVATHDRVADALHGQLDDSPFPDIVTARAALLTPAAQRDLDERVLAADDERSRLAGVLDDPDLAGLPDDEPDTDGAAAALAAADADLADAQEAHGALVRDLDELRRLADEHRRAEAALTARRAAATVVQGVADRCAGRLAPRISLQRWVLAAYLQQICTFANHRLDTMTGGRYELRVPTDGERGGRGSGLGLHVLDTHTGEERDVSTLSGGETFQASLALALGVADAVESHRGGVRLDALFVDEGFGTLDGDALQLAMDELDQLRAGGRMVGVISHVGALRERIRVDVEVIPSDRGSRLRPSLPAC